MVTILKYVILGILIYAAIIPILDELVVVIVQGLELIKGKLLYKATELQVKLNELAEESEDNTQTQTHVVGFSLPDEVYYDDEEDDEEDE